MTENDLRLIAFYLPQYHPVPENDEWWGKGFTEWTNVTKARPLYPGHYQPHLPADLGFYDLRLPEVREAQADLARSNGIHGFCYYHYWFNGRRILERPFAEVLASGKPDFPFCLCWANENWTRRWDGGESHVLLEQNYSHEDDRQHIRSLFPAFRDSRYIKINGKPLFLVYRTELLPDPAVTAEIWREEARGAGIGEIYLARVENFTNDVDPRNIGFDAAIEFAPDMSDVGRLRFNGGIFDLLGGLGLLPRVYREDNIANYQAMVEGMLKRTDPDFVRFHCVTPSWDNSARRKKGAWIYSGSTPQRYQQWLEATIARTAKKYNDGERVVFINAWNEWAEGCHLEPDLKWGSAYLEATKAAFNALLVTQRTASETFHPKSKTNPVRKGYWKLRKKLEGLVELYRAMVFRG